jgi:hypothetical protein
MSSCLKSTYQLLRERTHEELKYDMLMLARRCIAVGRYPDIETLRQYLRVTHSTVAVVRRGLIDSGQLAIPAALTPIPGAKAPGTDVTLSDLVAQLTASGEMSATMVQLLREVRDQKKVEEEESVAPVVGHRFRADVKRVLAAEKACLKWSQARRSHVDSGTEYRPARVAQAS